MGNTAEEKAIVYKKFLSRKHTSDFADDDNKNQIEERKRKNINTLGNCFAIEDINEDDDSYEFDTIYNINPSYMSNGFDINNISSNNTSNDYKAIDESEFRNPFIKQETATNLTKKKKIFEIYKMNKRIGRIKKNSGYIGKHNKLSEDNVIRKIKRRFLENVRIYINKEYKKYYLKKKINVDNNNWIKKISPKFYGQIKKIDNIKWFNSKIFEVFSENLSLRYSSHSLDSNKQNILKFLSSNESSTLKDILNTKVEILFSRYIENVKIEGFKTLNDDIKELEKQMKDSGQDNIVKYLKKYEDTAKNLKYIFNKKIERKLKTK
jgi:hypothetical protein